MSTTEKPSPPRRRLRPQFGLRALGIVVLLVCIVSAYLGYDYAERMRAANSPVVVQVPVLVHTFVGHDEFVQSVVFSPDGRLLASAAADGVRVWDVTTENQLHLFQVSFEKVCAVDFSDDSTRLAAVCRGDRSASQVIVWDVETGSQRCAWQVEDGANCVGFLADGENVVCGGGPLWESGHLSIRNLHTGKVVRQFTGHKAQVNAVAVSPDGKRIVSAAGMWDSGCDVRIWDIASGREVRRFDEHEEQINAVAFSPDGCFVVSASGGNGSSWSHDTTVRVWEISSGKCVRSFDEKSGDVRCVGVLRGGRYIVFGSSSGRFPLPDYPLRIVDIQTGKQSACVDEETGSLEALAISPDSRFVVTGGAGWGIGGYKGKVKMWKVAK